MSTQLQATYGIASVESLDAYIQSVNAIPLLTVEEETDLATRLFEEGDKLAAKKLVAAHLRYVVRVAKGYLGYGLPLGDLIQEGNVGLMKATKRFDPKMGVRLVTFAAYWIKSEIHEYVLKNWRIVKVATTKAQRKLFFNLRKMRNSLGWMSCSDQKRIAKELDVTERDVQTMEMRLQARDCMLALPGEMSSSDTEKPAMSAESLASPESDPAELVAMVQSKERNFINMRSAFENLDSRSQAVIAARWLQEDKMTLQALADKLGVSLERVRQIEKAALEKLKKLMVKH